MKKLKLLSCVSALLVVFSLGACEEVGDTSSNIESDSDTSETSIETGESSELENDESSESSESSELENDESSESSESSEIENDGSSDLPSNPEDFLKSIYEYCNYSVVLEYEFSTSTNYITYYQYITGEYDHDAIWTDFVESGYKEIIEIYYTENTVLGNVYYDYGSYSFGDLKYYVGSYVYVNSDDGVCWEYIYDYNSGYISYGHAEGNWTTYCYSLMYAYDNGVADGFTYIETINDESESYDSYSISEDLKPYLFLGLGTDFLFSSPTSDSKSSTHEYTHFYSESQKMISNFTNRVYIVEQSYYYYPTIYSITATVSDIGQNTDDDAYYMHEYVQSLIS